MQSEHIRLTTCITKGNLQGSKSAANCFFKKKTGSFHVNIHFDLKCYFVAFCIVYIDIINERSI